MSTTKKEKIEFIKKNINHLDQKIKEVVVLETFIAKESSFEDTIYQDIPSVKIFVNMISDDVIDRLYKNVKAYVDDGPVLESNN